MRRPSVGLHAIGLTYRLHSAVMTKPTQPFSNPMNILLLVSGALFIAACAMPSLEFKNSKGVDDVMLGLRALVVGWSGVFAAVVAWYANPFYLLGVVLAYFRQPVLALLAGLVAIAISATVFSVVGRELPGDEGNVTKTTIIKLLPGCYVWLTSMILLPIAALVQKLI
jgi:hypothetical protein